MELCYMNGKFLPLSEASLPVTDLIIQRGVGIFEAIHCPGKKLLALDAHLDRLFDSADKMSMAIPMTREEMVKVLKEGVLRFDGDPCLARIYVTGGDEMPLPGGRFQGRIYFLFLQGHEVPEEVYLKKGVSLFSFPQERFCPIVKTINYSAALTLCPAHPKDMEALYCPNGEVTECMSSNFFLWVGRCLVTAPLSRVLAGTTRGIVLILAKEAGYTVEERCPTVQELQNAEEAFLSGSSRLVIPVTAVDGKPVGKGVAGPQTVDLHRRVVAELDRWLTSALS